MSKPDIDDGAKKRKAKLDKLIKDHQIGIILAGLVIDSQLSYAERLKQGEDEVGDTVGAIEKAAQAIFSLLAAEAVDLSELGDDGVYHKIGKFIPIDKLKAIMEIKEL